MQACFFDNNATVPLRPEAKAAWCAAVDDLWLNPSSPYRAAARVAVHLAAVREQFAEQFAVGPERVVFNSGATEGNNTVFAHWAATLPVDARIGVSPAEHPSVTEAAKRSFGARVEWLVLDANGAVDLHALQARLAAGAYAAVSVMAANNETGVLNPWAAIAQACRAAGCQYHCDATQWIGKLPAGGLSECDFVTGCGHKFGGPRGIGFCIVSNGARAVSLLAGGAQEQGHRAGTEDVAGIVSMQAALGAAAAAAANCSVASRDLFIESIGAALPEVEFVGLGAERLWNTLSLIVPEFASVRWIRALEKRGFLVSAGSACSTGKAGPSPVLAAMGLDADKARRALRISAGTATTAADWVGLSAALVASYASLRSEAEGSGSKVISI
jgi:cysteine desulfurase